MEAHEIPVDCFLVRYTVIGSTSELTSAWEFYSSQYPTIQYGTRIEDRTENTMMIQRFKTAEGCKNACLHEVRPAPLEQGKDHTVLQVH